MIQAYELTDLSLDLLFRLSRRQKAGITLNETNSMGIHREHIEPLIAVGMITEHPARLSTPGLAEAARKTTRFRITDHGLKITNLLVLHFRHLAQSKPS